MVTWRFRLDAAAADYSRESLGFSGLRALLRVDCKTRSVASVVTVETRDPGVSLDPTRLPESRLLEMVRGYWQIENSLHVIKVLKQHVSAGEIPNIQSILPGEIRSLWPELYTCHES